MTEFANIELALIEPSLTNPRKTFNPAKLAELTESIKTTGIHQPVLVRPPAWQPCGRHPARCAVRAGVWRAPLPRIRGRGRCHHPRHGACID